MKNFFKDEEGATAVEYSLIAVAIAAVIIGSVTILGIDVTGMFTDTSHGW